MLGQKLAFIFGQSEYYKVLLSSKHSNSQNQNFDYRICDVTLKNEVEKIISDFSPDVVINAAAMTDVDGCEIHKEEAWKSNVIAVENIVSLVKNSIHVIHFSTDYVFDGKSGPYIETATPNPISYYGKTKLASENILFGSKKIYTILRTIVLFGTAKNVKQNFALWVFNSLKENKQIRVVNDQFANPTFVNDLAFAALQSVEKEREGLFNIGGREILSRFDFACRIAKIFSLDSKLIFPISTMELKQVANRPLNSGLITLKAEVELNFHPSTLNNSLETFKHQIKNYA